MGRIAVGFRPHHRARSHAVHPHFRPEFQGQGMGHCRLRSLRHAVHGMPGKRTLRIDVEQVDDGAAGFLQLRGSGLGQEERRARVGSEQAIPLFGSHRAKRGGKKVRGIVDQAVESSEALHRGFDQGRHLREIGQVGLQCQGRIGTFPFELRDQLIEIVA